MAGLERANLPRRRRNRMGQYGPGDDLAAGRCRQRALIAEGFAVFGQEIIEMHARGNAR